VSGDVVVRVQVDDFGDGFDGSFPDNSFIMRAEVFQVLEYNDVLVVEKGAVISKVIRDVGILFGDGKNDLIILSFGEVIEEGEEGVFDGIEGHKSGDDGESVDGVDTGGEVVGFELLFEEVEGVDIVHDF
jgi:hypothetical protein